MTAVLDTLAAAGVIDALDVHFARLLDRRAARGGAPLLLAAALASRRTGDGHVCLELPAVAGTSLVPDGPTAPPLAAWTAALRDSGVVGRPGDVCPLVLDAADRLYLWRYWDYEQRVARGLRARAVDVPDAPTDAALARDLALLFPEVPGVALPDWQRVAAATAALRGLCVISGGPGTGKTSTVVRLLALLALHAPAPLRIALAAPTGKAAARMQEAIAAARDALPVTPEVRAALPAAASTVHRLLGPIPDSVYFRHHADNPLPYDVVVVDEASMVDLALMAKLVDALPPQARLVLLGDKDQLASVEAGAVLGDVCGPVPGPSDGLRARLAAVVGAPLPPSAPSRSPLRDSVVVLRHSHRFPATSGIGRLAATVNAGDAAAALALLRAGADDVAWHAFDGVAGLRDALADAALDGFAPYLERVRAGAPREEIVAAFAAFRVLCAHRDGPGGVALLNADVEARLAERGIASQRGPWYAGRPVMVTRNDPAQQLFNGDVGVTLPDDDGDLRIWFPSPQGLRAVSPARLPEHETVWALTVHKSQGSEFDRVLLALPAAPSRVTTRELLYTAVTRARQRMEVWAPEAVLVAAIERRLERSSGLRDALWSV
jgi:exodeoxyribonuclease V alpha subunit